MEKIYGMHKLVGLQLFWSGTPTFSSGTPTFCQMGFLNSCFQNPSESSAVCLSLFGRQQGFEILEHLPYFYTGLENFVGPTHPVVANCYLLVLNPVT